MRSLWYLPVSTVSALLPCRKLVVLEDALALAVTEASAEPLPLNWQGCVSAATEAALQEAIKQTDKQGPLANLP